MGKEKEKVIFRKCKDRYAGDYYMAIFPDEEVLPGRVCIVDMWKNGDGWTHDSFAEINKSVIWGSETKIVHKNDPIVAELVNALKQFYGGEYQVCEKIVKGMRAY